MKRLSVFTISIIIDIGCVMCGGVQMYWCLVMVMWWYCVYFYR